MGIYLSTPSTTIDSEEGEGGGIHYGVADMQGWRKSMEDAHITLVDMNKSADGSKSNGTMMSLFGVFDGHGGKEVAKFVRIKYPELLVSLQAFAEGRYEHALRESFHKVDEMLEDKQYDKLLRELKILPSPSDMGKGGMGENETRSQRQVQRSMDDADIEDPDKDEKSNSKNSISTSEAVDMIRKILNNAQSKKEGRGDAVAASADEPSSPDKDDEEEEEQDSDNDADRYSYSLSKTGGPYKASIETINGMQCNLRDHRVTAGCTAVVAFLVGGKLVVANAGDSRGVLCRKGGQAYGLSEDHKPQQEGEMRRITESGGFVNGAGRINGNLNLSRSLGDLKYKQNSSIGKSEQMITAEPDITVTKIEPTDRFFILACDGIWDCLTNQGACDFVTEKLDMGLSPPEVMAQMCKHCLADDPRHTAGIGGDNMTALLVLLNEDGVSVSSSSSSHSREGASSDSVPPVPPMVSVASTKLGAGLHESP